ncbi:MAG: diaminopimelate decarboxylase [Gemmatimonadetes bacterium]|nr:diaminopimelate decarboxylase [Gemmatimonadota bacterium]
MAAHWPIVGGALHCERVPLSAIAAAVGTPTYVYSSAGIREACRQLDAALAGIPHRLHYAMKANGSLGVLGVVRGCGAGIDCVSGGELYRARQAGFRGADTFVGGVGKNEDEIAASIAAEVACITAESDDELRLISRVAVAAGATAPVAIRVNPEVAVEAFHEYVKTGQSGDKFGIPFDAALGSAQLAASLPGLRLVGLHQHLGSQLFGMAALAEATGKLLGLLARLRAESPAAAAALATLDLGGGIGVRYEDEDEPDLAELGRIAREAHAASGLEICLEPGRFLVAGAGALLTRVLYHKRSGARTFVVTDAGMNDLLRPALYDAYHRVEAVHASPLHERVEVVGPVCESGDFLALDREIGAVRPGDLLTLQTAGAYGFVMSSNYNARPRAAEVLVDGARWGVIRERERHEDLVRGERVTPEWSTIA